MNKRSYQIYQDKFRIQLGGPFGVNISLISITEVNKASTDKAFAYWGMRFATSTSNLVEIKRKGKMNVIISPSDADIFTKQLEKEQLALKLHEQAASLLQDDSLGQECAGLAEEEKMHIKTVERIIAVLN